MKFLGKVMLLVAIATSLPACGTVGGALTGGLIGSAFGKGTGKTLAVLGGAMLGGYVGSKLDKKQKADRYYAYYKSRYK